MCKYLVFLLTIVLQYQHAFCQQDSTLTTKHRPLAVKMIVPAGLFLSGVLLSGTQLEKDWQIDIRNKVGNDFESNIDDFIQYTPYVQIYLGDIIGLQAKNHWFDQTKNFFLGGVLTMAITHSLKRGVGKERPNGSSNHSFSSGHTATSFMGATMLYHEFSDASLLYASSGYLFSTTTASYRVMNNKHWVSDVVAGAAVGILVANIIYHIEPLKNWNPFKKTKNLSFSPMLDDKGFTFMASYQF